MTVPARMWVKMKRAVAGCRTHVNTHIYIYRERERYVDSYHWIPMIVPARMWVKKRAVAGCRTHIYIYIYREMYM